MDYDDYGQYEDYDDYIDYDDYDYDALEWRDYEIEPTWFYEWRGHFFYDNPTMKQKFLVVMHDIWLRIKSKFVKYDDIPF